MCSTGLSASLLLLENLVRFTCKGFSPPGDRTETADATDLLRLVSRMRGALVVDWCVGGATVVCTPDLERETKQPISVEGGSTTVSNLWMFDFEPMLNLNKLLPPYLYRSLKLLHDFAGLLFTKVVWQVLNDRVEEDRFCGIIGIFLLR